MYERALFYSQNDFLSSEFHLGKMLHLTNQFNKALKFLSNVVGKLPNDQDVYNARGSVYQDMGNHLFAIRDFNHALKLNPDNSLSYYYRGMSKLKSKLFFEALDDFLK